MTFSKKRPVALAGAHEADIEAVGTAIDSQNPTAPDLSPQARWNTENPKALWAHQALRSAIKKGLIERGPCEVCGAVHGVDGAIIDGHHDPDRYDEPLHVTFLCRLHHRRLHAAERAGGDDE